MLKRIRFSHSREWAASEVSYNATSSTSIKTTADYNNEARKCTLPYFAYLYTERYIIIIENLAIGLWLFLVSVDSENLHYVRSVT